MAGPKKNAEADNRPFVPSVRSILYLSTFILIFCLSCVNLGLVSQQIHRYGRFAENYASLQYKNAIGLLLAAVIISMLISMFHMFLPLGMLLFFSLCAAVFFGVVAGIFRTATPFRGTSCGAPVDSYPVKWQPYVRECSRIVTMQGISWTLWALYIFVIIGTMAYMFRITTRPTPGGYYGSPTRTQV